MTRAMVRKHHHALLGVASLGIATASCAGGAPAGSQPANVRISAPSAAPTSNTLAEVRFSPQPIMYGVDCLVPVAPGRLVIGGDGDLMEFDGAHIRHRASADENLWEGGWHEIPYGCGVGPNGDGLLITATSKVQGPPWDDDSHVYRLVSRAWVVERGLTPSSRGLKIVAWSKGRWLVLDRHGFNPQAAFTAPGAGQDLPRLSPAAFDPYTSAIEPADFAALTTGEVVVVGRLRKPSDPPVAFDELKPKRVLPGFNAPDQQRGAWERFAPGASKGVLEPLTWGNTNLLPCCVQLRSPTEAWLAGATSQKRGFVGRWDGHAWRFVGIPKPVLAFDVEPEGTIWAATSSEVERGTLDGAFEAIPFPNIDGFEKGGTPERLVVTGPGDAWMALHVRRANSSGAAVLVRTKPKPPVEPLPVSKEEEQARSLRDAADWRSHPIYEPSSDLSECRGFLVMIEDIPKTSEIDYARIAGALKGRNDLAKAQFIEYALKGVRRFGARVPDAATGKTLVAALAKVVNPSPRLACFQTTAIKRIVFDFKAGTVSSAGPP